VSGTAVIAGGRTNPPGPVIPLDDLSPLELDFSRSRLSNMSDKDYDKGGTYGTHYPFQPL
jgi:hypothetical protein